MNLVFIPDDSDEWCGGSFTITIHGWKLVTIGIHELAMFDASRYCDLAAGRNGTLTYCDSNGLVQCSSNGAEIGFEVCKTGAGGGGDIDVTIPLAQAADALYEAASHVEKFQNRIVE